MPEMWRSDAEIMNVRQIYKWIVLRIKERYRECPEYFLILDDNWLNNEDEEVLYHQVQFTHLLCNRYNK